MHSILRKLFKNKNEFLRKFFFDKKALNVFSYKYTAYYIKKDSDELSKICQKYLANKGYNISQQKNSNFRLEFFQNYSDYYSEIFHQNRSYIKNVLELGIGSVDKNNQYNMNMLGKNYKPGASLRVWRDYFRKANIFGADIDKKTLFKEKRITTTYVNQSDSKSISKMFKKFGVKTYDLIIDDGCHRFDDTIIFFNNAINKLSNNGIYIIEDIVPSQRKKFLKFFKSSKLQVKLINFYRPKKNILSNCLITIRKNK
jgi:hypothetical protein